MAKLPSSKAKLAEFNEKHCVLMLNGKTFIFSWEPNSADPTKRVPAFATVPNMRTFYSNQFVTVMVNGPNGPIPTKKSAFDVWMQSADRPTAIGVVIDPNGGRFVGESLNLWRGFGVEPKEGDWPLLRRHIEDVVCSGNKDQSKYLFRWMAWKLQNPTRPPEVAIVLRGLKGTGKGTLMQLLLDIFDIHGHQISDRKHLVGSFNSHLMKCLFLNADEALWPGDKASEGPLKRLITEPTLFIEPKGIDAFEVPNMLAVVLTGNAGWMVPASDDERRYAVFDVSDAHRQDFAYFEALRAEIANGGAAAFLHRMLNADLKGWHPRMDIPQTQGLADQKMESADAEVHWLGGILNEGALPFSVRDESGGTRRIVHRDFPNLARSQLLWKHARATERRLQHWTEPTYQKFLADHGIHKADDMRTNEGRYRRFPPLAEARRLFREKHPWWLEFEGEGTEWRFSEERHAYDKMQREYEELHEEAASEVG